MWQTLLENFTWLAAGFMFFALLIALGGLLIRSFSQQNPSMLLTGTIMFLVGAVVLLVALGVTLAAAARDQRIAVSGTNLALALVNALAQLILDIIP